jgi:hypothetical protein
LLRAGQSDFRAFIRRAVEDLSMFLQPAAKPLYFQRENLCIV